MKNTWMKLASLALALGPVAGIAADYPIKDKTVTLIVPFAAGGPTDRVARDLAEAMRKTLGASVVVENAAGGPGGLIGAAKVAKANPDGHTLLVHHIAMSISQNLYFDMARTLNKLLNKYTIITKAIHCLSFTSNKTFKIKCNFCFPRPMSMLNLMR